MKFSQHQFHQELSDISSQQFVFKSFLIVLFLQRASQQCFVFAIPNEIFVTSIPSRKI